MQHDRAGNTIDKSRMSLRLLGYGVHLERLL